MTYTIHAIRDHPEYKGQLTLEWPITTPVDEPVSIMNAEPNLFSNNKKRPKK